MNKGQLYYLPNAHHPRQRSEMEVLEMEGICIFCPEHYAKSQEDRQVLVTHPLGECLAKVVLLENNSWVAIENEYPYDGALVQVMLVPRVHTNRRDELSPGTWVDYADILRKTVEYFDLPAYAEWSRNGHPSLTGATIFHLHVQIALRDPKYTGGPLVAYFSSKSQSPSA